MSHEISKKLGQHPSRRALVRLTLKGTASLALARAALPLAGGVIIASQEAKAAGPLIVIPLTVFAFMSLVQTLESSISLYDFATGETAGKLRNIADNTRQILNNQEQILTQIQGLRYVFREELERGFRQNRERDLVARVAQFEDLRVQSAATSGSGVSESQFRRLQEHFAALSNIFGTYGPEGFASFVVASAHNISVMRASNAMPELVAHRLNDHKAIAAQWIAETGPRSIMPLYNDTMSRVRTLQRFMNERWSYQISEFSAKSSDSATLGIFRRSIQYDGWNVQVGAPRLTRITERVATHVGTANFPYEYNFNAGAGAYPFRARTQDIERMACLAGDRSDYFSMRNFPLRDGNMNIDLVETPAVRERDRLACITNTYAEKRRELVELEGLAARQLDFINAVRALMAQYDRGVSLVTSQRNVPQVPLLPNIRRG